MISTFRLLGVPRIPVRLGLVAVSSFIAGTAQAGLLILLSDVGVDAAQGKHRFTIHHTVLGFRDIMFICAGLLAVFALASLASAFTNSKMAASALEGSRRSLIEAYFGADWATQATERLGHIQQLLTMQCLYVANVAGGLASGAQSLLGFVALILAAFIVSPVTAVSVLVVGVLIFLLLRPFNTWSRRTSSRTAAATEQIGTLVTEYTRLTREFRVLGVEPQAIDYLKSRSHGASLAFHRGRQIGQIVPTVYQTLALSIVIFSFGIFIAHHGTGLASIAAVLLLILRSLNYGAGVQSSAQQLSEYEGILISLRSEYERLRNHAQHQLAGLEPNGFAIECRNVSFCYDGSSHHALEDVNFNLPEGQILGIAGRSGSGKTTLSQILLGLRVPSSGSALIGVVDASRVARSGSVSRVALVTQEPVLLQASIASNIAFFRDVPREAIVDAARAAHIDAEIEAMPDKYDTLVGEGGSALSGGQRQRLAIARALVGKPRLLVLDEPTSALDGRSEALIARSLSELRGQMTIVVISHRLTTIDDCDLLLVLDAGRPVAFGPRPEVQSSAPFRTVVEAGVHA